MIPGASASRAATGRGSCDDASDVQTPDASAPPRLARWPGGDRLARSRGLRRGPWAGASRAAVGSDAAARLDVRALADAGHRRRRHLVVVGGSARERRASGQSRAGSPVRGLRRRPGGARRRARCRASIATTRRCSRCTWSSTCCCAGGRAADRPVRPDHPGPASCLAGHPAALGPAGPPFARDEDPRVPRGRLGHLRERHVGQPLLAAVRCGPRGPARPRPGARPVPRSGACCSGGRRSRSIRRRGACPTRPAPCTCSSRCRRTRSSPSCSSAPRRRSTRITPRSCGPGGRRPSPISRRRPASCGSSATRSSSWRSWPSWSAGCGPRPATPRRLDRQAAIRDGRHPDPRGAAGRSARA